MTPAAPAGLPSARPDNSRDPIGYRLRHPLLWVPRHPAVGPTAAAVTAPPRPIGAQLRLPADPASPLANSNPAGRTYRRRRSPPAEARPLRSRSAWLLPLASDSKVEGRWGRVENDGLQSSLPDLNSSRKKGRVGSALPPAGVAVRVEDLSLFNGIRIGANTLHASRSSQASALHRQYNAAVRMQTS